MLQNSYNTQKLKTKNFYLINFAAKRKNPSFKLSKISITISSISDARLFHGLRTHDWQREEQPAWNVQSCAGNKNHKRYGCFVSSSECMSAYNSTTKTGSSLQKMETVFGEEKGLSSFGKIFKGLRVYE